MVKDLVKQKGYSETYALNQIYNGGYRIYTTLDPDVQSALDEVYADGSTFPTQYQNGEVREVQPESAAIVMDYTGAIRGLVAVSYTHLFHCCLNVRREVRHGQR